MSDSRSFERRMGQLVVGRLQAHGRAPYQFRAEEDVSYFVTLITMSGVKTFWGKDLARAIQAGATQPQLGDLVGARRTGRQAVTLIDRQRDARGNVQTQREHHAHRMQWEVEKLPFFADRARRARLARDAHADTRDTVKQRPELRSTFLSLRAAEQLAAQRIADPQDREKFLSMVREAMAESSRRGTPMPEIHCGGARRMIDHHRSSQRREGEMSPPDDSGSRWSSHREGKKIRNKDRGDCLCNQSTTPCSRSRQRPRTFAA
jgi:hypothetical protein